MKNIVHFYCLGCGCEREEGEKEPRQERKRGEKRGRQRETKRRGEGVVVRENLRIARKATKLDGPLPD